MKFRLLLFSLNLLSMSILAQSPYKLSGPQEAAWLGGSGAGIGLSVGLHYRHQPFTPEQVAALDPGRVPAFDRYALRHYSSFARKSSDVALFSTLAIPALLLLDPDIRPDAGTVGVLLGEAFLVNTALTLTAKELVRRPRPFTYNPGVPLTDKLDRDARLSFFSGHTSTAAAMTFATAAIWSEYHPGSDWKPLVWTSAVLVPATVGYLRMRAGKHFLSDVAAGFVVGAATGWLVPYLHRR